MRSEELLRKINKMNLSDPMTRDILAAIGREMDKTDEENEQIDRDRYFSTCSEEMLRYYERFMGITPLPSQDLDDRRASAEAKWKSTGKVDLLMLQAVADSWKYGRTKIEYVDNRLQVTFVDTLGVPKDTAGLEFALDEVKPAHIPIIFLAIYLYVRDVNAMTVSELQSHLIGDFAF